MNSADGQKKVDRPLYDLTCTEVVGIVTNAAYRILGGRSTLMFTIDSMPDVAFELKMPYRIDVGETVKLFNVVLNSVRNRNNGVEAFGCSITSILYDNFSLAVLKDNIEVFRVDSSSGGSRGGRGLAPGWGGHH